MRPMLERFLKAKATYSSAAVVQGHMQDRLIALLKQALKEAKIPTSAQYPKPHFNCALVSLEDRIFPARYQMRGWEGHAKRIIHTHAPHFAFGDFESWGDLCEMEHLCDLC